MAKNNVFANGREISCKAASGKTICCFPDVCFTPPRTPAMPTGIPIPYPNTAFAKDTVKGSKTVFISGKPVMLKNKSYFKKSTGNEPGCANKGIITRKTKGKAYFTSWSMNVKIEGKNVCRHMDLTTHNHGSTTNTLPWAYIDTADMTDANQECKDGTQAMKDCVKKHSKKLKKPDDDGNPVYQKQQKAFCEDKECKKLTQCYVRPYEWECCDQKTPHHIVPAHCFMPKGERAKGAEGLRYEGCQDYDDKKAPCICLTGATKSSKSANGNVLQHGRVHSKADKRENEIGALNNNAWEFFTANEEGAKAVASVKKNCDEDCLAAQSLAAHKKMGLEEDTLLRADAYGDKTTKDFIPTKQKQKNISKD